MSQRDALLDELGLSPLWVRRDLPAAGATAGATADVVEDVAAAVIDRTVDWQTSAGPGAEPVRAEPVVAAASDAGSAVHESSRSDIVRSESTRPMSSPPVRAESESTPDTQSASSDDGFEGYEDMNFEPADYVPVDFVPPVEADAPALPSVATLDFPSLKARVADCTACRLCEKRTQTVFGVGDENADWMIVGEAPGENEDRIGEPFVGQAGKLLDNMLRALELNRASRVYIANVIKCRPPGNRDPQPDEVARCEPFLKRQVALIRPKVIVALGRFAAQTLLKTDATISSLRGRVHEYEGVPVIVSYHPAYLLRSLPDKSKAWADLCLAQATYRKAAD